MRAIAGAIEIIIPEDRQQEEEPVLGEIRAGRPVRHVETLRRRGGWRPWSSHPRTRS